MCVIRNLYKKRFLTRYDKDGIIPYLSYTFFKGLILESHTFTNSKNTNISYFIYYYPNYNKDKTIIFCHGIGPGHSAYMSEINELCKNGFKVITLDYTGCGDSGGSSIYSFNQPSNDIIELIDYLKLKEEIVLIGHSLGGYSALNVMSKKIDIKKAIIIAGFISIKKELEHFINSTLIATYLYNYEKHLIKDYDDKKLFNYLKTTSDKLLFIHSKDDQFVPYKDSTKIVKELNKENFTFIIEENKKHNPNYSKEALDYMNEVFANYNKLVSERKLVTLEDKQNYMKDKSAYKMTIQDEQVIKKIIEYIKA